MRRSLVLALSLSLAACAGGPEGDAAGATDSAAGATADPDRQTTGSGVPSGYTAQADREGADLSSLQYVARGGDAWEIRTGPAHIVYAAGDSASGRYTARAEFEQLEAPAHPEAFGLFIGGQGLDGPQRRYTYFVVRGTGEYLVRVREGGDTRDVTGWTKSPAVPTQDASGKATYRLAVEVTADSVRFLSNDQRVTAVAKNAVATDGIAGLRVNHNLHVRTGPVEVVKQ